MTRRERESFIDIIIECDRVSSRDVGWKSHNYYRQSWVDHNKSETCFIKSALIPLLNHY
jgi:hypothetical protein